MELFNGFRKLASGLLAYFEDGRLVHKGEAAPCDWLVEVPTASLFPPEAEWYPDSPADVYTIVPCGALALYDTEGRIRCEAGHFKGTLEEELGAGGYEWQREQEERY